MTLTKPYEATFQVGDGETKDFPFYFDEVSENFIRVIIKRADGSIYYPTFSVDMELLRVVFGEDEITPTPDDVICIYRDTPAIQDTQFNTLQGYNAKALENILSKIVAMIQEMKANGFSTQILQGEPWSLDLIKPADDGASVQIDYQARVLKKGLYFKMSGGNLLASPDGVNFVQMPKSENVAEFRQHTDDKGNTHFEYRVGDKWFGLATSADIADTYTKTEVDNKFVVANAQIDANADAIQKTREDFISADSEIHQILNNHASELTTLRGNQAALGDQVSGIEEKIPESASGSNPLITKQQLLDEEMDIRDDLNEMASELQTQITAQAAEIAGKQDQLTAGDNIIISNNVISATGAGGGAGFDIVVVQELPATGQKGIIYLLAKDGTAPDVYDEYVWITATQTFELIGSTKVDLSGYLPLSGGTITGPITLGMTGDPFSNVDVLKSSSGASLVTGMIESGSVLTLAVRTPLTIYKELLPLADVGQSFSKVPRIYVEKINNGADISIPTTGGTMALAENVETAISDAVANIDALPDQTGNAGKVLTTDGSTASWQEAPASGTKVIIKRYN